MSWPFYLITLLQFQKSPLPVRERTCSSSWKVKWELGRKWWENSNVAGLSTGLWSWLTWIRVWFFILFHIFRHVASRTTRLQGMNRQTCVTNLVRIWCWLHIPYSSYLKLSDLFNALITVLSKLYHFVFNLSFYTVVLASNHFDITALFSPPYVPSTFLSGVHLFLFSPLSSPVSVLSFLFLSLPNFSIIPTLLLYPFSLFVSLLQPIIPSLFLHTVRFSLSTFATQLIFSTFHLILSIQQLPKDVFFKLFDIKICPQVLYRSEIWGLDEFDELERIQYHGCKRFVCVWKTICNVTVLGDCNRYPLYIMAIKRSIKYWLK